MVEMGHPGCKGVSVSGFWNQELGCGGLSFSVDLRGNDVTDGASRCQEGFSWFSLARRSWGTCSSTAFASDSSAPSNYSIKS